MIGNDVVDLELAARQSNWRRKGFLEKVYTGEEQQEILGAKDPNCLVWLFWSMKEAAYKAHQRTLNLPRSLNWQDFHCALTSVSENTASGVVRKGKAEYFTTSEKSKDFVHTSAETSENRVVKNGIFETTSAEMKRLFLQNVSEVHNVQPQELQLLKDSCGIPYVSYQKTPFFKSFSFSGHGRFCAFSMAVNDL